MHIEELKEYFEDLNNETIIIEISEKQIPISESIVQPLLRHQDKPENGEIIREEQDAREEHIELQNILSANLHKNERTFRYITYFPDAIHIQSICNQ
jgi:hypothetical protein